MPSSEKHRQIVSSFLHGRPAQYGASRVVRQGDAVLLIVRGRIVALRYGGRICVAQCGDADRRRVYGRMVSVVREACPGAEVLPYPAVRVLARFVHDRTGALVLLARFAPRHDGSELARTCLGQWFRYDASELILHRGLASWLQLDAGELATVARLALAGIGWRAYMQFAATRRLFARRLADRATGYTWERQLRYEVELASALWRSPVIGAVIERTTRRMGWTAPRVTACLRYQAARLEALHWGFEHGRRHHV